MRNFSEKCHDSMMQYAGSNEIVLNTIFHKGNLKNKIFDFGFQLSNYLYFWLLIFGFHKKHRLLAFTFRLTFILCSRICSSISKKIPQICKFFPPKIPVLGVSAEFFYFPKSWGLGGGGVKLPSSFFFKYFKF